MAGVLIPIFEQDGSVHIVLTKRTHTVKIHKGEVSFPGGMFEKEDGTLQETALRECYEEIGVRKEDVEVIGRLDDMYTRRAWWSPPAWVSSPSLIGSH